MEVLYQDKNIVVCIKPVGLDSEKQAVEILKEQLGGDIYPLHRLDLNVGGVMVYARHSKSAALFSKMIQDNEMVKEYVAMVHGVVPEYEVWEDYLFKDSRKNKVFVVKKMRKGVKQAKLEYKRLTVEKDQSLVRVRLYTGRSHQIRVQFASRGFPLVGDHKYGSRADVASPMLFSCRLSFPYQGKTYCFESYPLWAQKAIQLDIQKLSSHYEVRRLEKENIDQIYDLCKENPLFYEYHPPFVTKESIEDDIKALPPRKEYKDKYFIGFFEGEMLVAFMDLILDYPNEKTAFIGFFMMNRDYQGKGIGTHIIDEAFAYLKEKDFEKVRLAYAKGNPQSEAFWTKNGFLKTGLEIPNDFSGYIIMEKELEIKR